ncbi:MAG: molybdopterin-dependent oxidoreductase [Anaerolineales bacterium]
MTEPHGLPPGQQVLDEFPRFGLPTYMRRWPEVPARPTLAIGGLVEEPCDVVRQELAVLARTDLVADFHCVATWSRTGLRWEGVPFRDFYEEVVAPKARPHPQARWVRFRGLDGYFATLHLDDALAPDLLLADVLDGAPLPLEHGAPLRLVAPAHYGYKSVKHLTSIELGKDFSPKRFKPTGFTEHPRARVLREERAQGAPGPALGEAYAAMLPDILRAYRRFAHPPDSQARH